MINQTQLQHIQAIWSRRKGMALLLASATLAAVVSFSVFLPNLYEARAVILVQRPSGDDGRSNTQYLETLLHSLTKENMSRPRLQELVERFDLYPELRELDVPDTFVVERLRRDVSIETEEVSQGWGLATVAVVVRYLGTDPNVVAGVTNDIAGYYAAQHGQERQRELERTMTMLQARLEQLRGQLASEETQVQQFKSRFGGEMPEQVAVHLSAIDQLQADLRVNRETQMQAIRQRQGLLGAQASSTSGLPLSPLAELKRQLRELRGNYTDEHPDVKLIKSRIASLERSEKRGHKATGLGATMREERMELEGEAQDLQDLKREERTLMQTIKEREERIRRSPLRQQQLAEILPSYETTRDTYQNLLRLYGDAQLATTPAGGLVETPFRLLEPAVVPEQPSAPNRIRLGALGLAAAAALALLIVFLLERYDTSFHTLEDLRQFTRVPVVGSVPRIVTAEDKRRQRWQAALFIVATAIVVALVVGVSYSIANGNQDLVFALAENNL